MEKAQQMGGHVADIYLKNNTHTKKQLFLIHVTTVCHLIPVLLECAS